MPRSTESLSAYYTRTAGTYEEAHFAPGDEHFVALEYVVALISALRARSVLDVGCGTGRGVRFIKARRPDCRVVGVEPVAALRERAVASGVGEYVDGQGEHLPFKDGEFDIAVATGVLHHVPHPRRVVREMARVATTAVMVSDMNRFGSGSPLARWVKTAMFSVGLGRPLILAKTKGRGYVYLAGDGRHYPYSVYDDIPFLAKWADRLFMIPTAGAPASGKLGPLLRNSAILLVAVRERFSDPSWARLE
jgi:ubiquinone/menaquinone biosynthesis C-methylase UbiE